MDREVGILLVIMAAVGMFSMLLLVRRERLAHAGPAESEFAVSTEGEKRCPKCGLGNLVTSGTCAGCGAQLSG